MNKEVVGYALEALRFAAELVEIVQRDDLSRQDVEALRAKLDDAQRRRKQAIEQLEQLLEGD